MLFSQSVACRLRFEGSYMRLDKNFENVESTVIIEFSENNFPNDKFYKI